LNPLEFYLYVAAGIGSVWVAHFTYTVARVLSFRLRLWYHEYQQRQRKRADKRLRDWPL
jgi:hypothetical protein